MDERERFFDAISPNWRPQYTSGRRELDDEHKALFDGFNSVLQLFRAETDALAIATAYSDLVVACAEHFTHEEALLQAIRYPGLERHRLLHESLLDRAHGLLAKLSSNPASTLEVAASRLAEVIVLHVVVEDRKFFPYLKNL